MIRNLIIVAALAALAACASRPGERVALHSADYGFVDEILAGDPGTPRRLWAQLALPETGTPPYPAVVLVHSAQGRDTQMWMYTERFRALGMVTLTLDSFTQRGIQKIMEDQTEVTEASMIADTYAALRLLAAAPEIDANRIAVFGISKGGAPSVYTMLESFADRLAPGGERFALHVAYYPWCGIDFLERRATGAPLLIQAGSRDGITPPALCAELIENFEAANPELEAQLVVHEGARHAFDHPYLAYLPAIPTTYLTPRRCRIREVRPGEFIETSRTTELTSANLTQALRQCSAAGFLAGGDPEAGAAAWEITREAFVRHLDLHIVQDQGW